MCWPTPLELAHDADAESIEHVARTDAGAHEHGRRVDGAAREHDLARGDRLDRAGAPHFDARGVAVFEDDAADVRVGTDCQVRTRSRAGPR